MRRIILFILQALYIFVQILTVLSYILPLIIILAIVIISGLLCFYIFRGLILDLEISSLYFLIDTENVFPIGPIVLFIFCCIIGSLAVYLIVSGLATPSSNTTYNTNTSSSNTNQHIDKGFYDGSGNWRTWDEPYQDAAGKWRNPGDSFIDGRGHLRNPGDGWQDSDGNYYFPNQSFKDGKGHWRK